MMLRSITDIVTYKLCNMLKSKKGADMVEWVAIIAVVVGIVMIISPQARSGIVNLFSGIFGNLGKMSVGQ